MDFLLNNNNTLANNNTRWPIFLNVHYTDPSSGLSSKLTFRFCTFSLHFIRLCAEFSFVYSNNQRMLLYKCLRLN